MIIGFSMDRIDAERKNHEYKGKLTIQNKLQIKDVKEEKLPLKDKKSALRFEFEYRVDYEPKVASLAIDGSILYMAADSDEIIKGFKKEKRIKNEKKSLEIMNAIADKCNVRALELAHDINLPPPFNLPRLSFKTSAKDYIG